MEFPQRSTDFLGLLDTHEGVFSMFGIGDSVQEVAEIASKITGLTEPEDGPSSKHPLRGF
jgi:hypothetical protein